MIPRVFFCQIGKIFTYLFPYGQCVFPLHALKYKWSMRSQYYKQTRDDTSVWKQIVALLFSAQQIHGNAADKSRGRNEPWSLHFSMPMLDLWHPINLCYERGLRGSLPSDKLYCVPAIRCLQRHCHHRKSKILLIYLKPGSWFSRSWFSFFREELSRSWFC